MFRTRIVVGVDGSAGSIAAVRWAAAEARLRQAELRVLTAYHRQRPVPYFGGQGRPPAEAGASAVVHAAVVQARSIIPETDVRGMAWPGYAVPVLLHAAEVASMLVVGDRGSRGMPGLPFGSVGIQVAIHARGSVVVVRGRSDADTGPVLVGVDDGPESAAILGRAFEEASLRGAGLLALTARPDGRARGAPTAEAALAGDLDPWREKYPEVAAEREFVAGRADKALTDRSRQARLVVVGPRRHGFEGVLLGSVGTRLLLRADCPVLIARG